MKSYWPFFIHFLLSFSAIADEKILLSGFGTLGLTISDSDIYGYRTDIGSDHGVFSSDIDFLENSKLGLQLDASITKDTDVVLQGVARNWPDATLDRFVTLAFLRYSRSPNWTFRIGRTAPEIFHFTEYRDIGFAYSLAALPSEVYGMIPYRHLDGFDISYANRFNDGTLRAKLFAGISDGDISSGSFTEAVQLNNIYGASLTWDYYNWTIQAQHTQAKIADDTSSNTMLRQQLSQIPDFLWPNAAALSKRLDLKNTKVEYSSLSSQIRLSNWSITAELARINADNPIIPKLNNGYFSLAYQRDEHTFFSYYALTESDNYIFNEPGVNPALFPELVMALAGTMNFYASNQQTLALGWRWDFATNLAAKLQWNMTDIDANGGTLWINSTDLVPSESVNTLIFNLSFVF